MTESELRQGLREILAKMCPDEDLSALRDDQPLRDQLGLDSMDLLDVVLEVRTRFHIHVPEEDFERLDTVDNAVQYLKTKAS